MRLQEAGVEPHTAAQVVNRMLNREIKAAQCAGFHVLYCIGEKSEEQDRWQAVLGVIVIPDNVKGGNQPTSHRKVAVRCCLDELYAAGVQKKDVLLLFSNGPHPRAAVSEMRTIPGDARFRKFYASGQITSHDSENYDHLVDLGFAPNGDHVILNKYVYDADVAILIGHTQGNPYGGYSGGYKHCATGITHWRSIAAHRVPQVMHRPDFVPVPASSRYAPGVMRRACSWKKRWAEFFSAATRCWTPGAVRSRSIPAMPGKCSP